MPACVECGRLLKGRQRKYCSRRCKNASTNVRHQNYRAQQRRGLNRKVRLLRTMGGECQICGYSRNLAALEFHHSDPSKKHFQLDLRSLSNRAWSQIEEEARKCALVCSNCHAEIHNPVMALEGVSAPSRALPGHQRQRDPVNHGKKPKSARRDPGP